MSLFKVSICWIMTSKMNGVGCQTAQRIHSWGGQSQVLILNNGTVMRGTSMQLVEMSTTTG